MRNRIGWGAFNVGLVPTLVSVAALLAACSGAESSDSPPTSQLQEAVLSWPLGTNNFTDRWYVSCTQDSDCSAGPADTCNAGLVCRDPWDGIDDEKYCLAPCEQQTGSLCCIGGQTGTGSGECAANYPPASTPFPAAAADTDNDNECDVNVTDLCFGSDVSGDSDSDGRCDSADQCQGDDDTNDTDNDNVCDDADVCLGNDASGDSDTDGICDDQDVCVGVDSSGDTDSDGVCDSDDLCQGDDAEGDTDADDVCDDVDLCIGDDAVALTVASGNANQVDVNPADGTCDYLQANCLPAEGLDLDNDSICGCDENPPTDFDNDGRTDCEEGTIACTVTVGLGCTGSGSFFSSASDSDSDNDTLNDGDECAVGLNPAAADTDHDGLSDVEENDSSDYSSTAITSAGTVGFSTNLSPTLCDTDSDGRGDAWERANGTNGSDNDTDSDGALDGLEVTLGLNPKHWDSDGDGLSDSADIAPQDDNACGDSDEDGCDDCALEGEPAPENDGPDADGDGQCDVTDPPEADADGDGVADAADNCPSIVNPDQLDSDNDDVGNECDGDDDGDGVSDEAELLAGTNPLDSNEVGVSVGGALVINLGDSIQIVFASDQLGPEIISVQKTPADQEPTSDLVDILSRYVWEFSPDGATFTPPMQLTLRFTGSLQNGQQAVIAWLDESREPPVWVPLEGCSVEGNAVTCPVSHFTKFAVIALETGDAGVTDAAVPPGVVDAAVDELDAATGEPTDSGGETDEQSRDAQAPQLDAARPPADAGATDEETEQPSSASDSGGAPEPLVDAATYVDGGTVPVPELDAARPGVDAAFGSDASDGFVDDDDDCDCAVPGEKGGSAGSTLWTLALLAALARGRRRVAQRAERPSR